MKNEVLVVTMEECGELVQACSKVIRTRGSKKRYLNNLKDEIGDVLLMCEILKNNGYVTEEEIKSRMEVKKNKLKKWSNIYDE